MCVFTMFLQLHLSSTHLSLMHPLYDYTGSYATQESFLSFPSYSSTVTHGTEQECQSIIKRGVATEQEFINYLSG